MVGSPGCTAPDGERPLCGIAIYQDADVCDDVTLNGSD